MFSVTLDIPSPKCASCGTAAEKSVPGFAVPDSVHQVKLVSPRELPLRCTVTSADLSPAGTSTVSATNSIFEAPVGTAGGGAAAWGVTVRAATVGGAAARGATVGCAAARGATAGGAAPRRAADAVDSGGAAGTV